MNMLMRQMGGAEIVCLRLIKVFAEMPECEIFLVCEKTPSNLRIELENYGCKVIEINFSRIGTGHSLSAALDWLMLPVLARKIAGILAKIKPDILNPHNFPDVFYATYYKNLKKNVRVSWFCHEPYRPFYDKNVLTFKPPSERVFFTLYRGFISPIDLKHVRSYVNNIGANSNYTANLIRRIYGKEAVVIYPGIDVDRFRPVSSNLKEDLECNYLILSVGRIDFSYKNLWIIPMVLKRIRPKYNVKWVHIGSGRDELRLRNFAKNLGVQNALEVLGHVSDNELVNYYSAANVVVYPSIGEPFGLVPLEAMACGTPVIVSNLGGTSETVVHGKTGLSVDMTSISEISSAVSYILENGEDARKMGWLGRQRVSKYFTLDQMIKDYFSFIGIQ